MKKLLLLTIVVFILSSCGKPERESRQTALKIVPTASTPTTPKSDNAPEPTPEKMPEKIVKEKTENFFKDPILSELISEYDYIEETGKYEKKLHDKPVIKAGEIIKAIKKEKNLKINEVFKDECLEIFQASSKEENFFIVKYIEDVSGKGSYIGKQISLEKWSLYDNGPIVNTIEKKIDIAPEDISLSDIIAWTEYTIKVEDDNLVIETPSGEEVSFKIKTNKTLTISVEPKA